MALAVVVALLAGAGAAVAVVLIVSRTGRAPHESAGTVPTTGRSPGGAASVGGGTATAPGTTASTSTTATTGTATSTGAGTGTAAGNSAYTGAHFTAEIPAGWKIEENDISKEGFTESKWRSPTTSADFALVDATPDRGGSPEQDAAPVRADLRRLSDYTEVAWGPGDLSGVNSWRWVFRASGAERVDYFFSACGEDFAVLGSTPTGSFAALLPTFTNLAGSVRGTC
jgi:hypothetical protein